MSYHLEDARGRDMEAVACLGVDENSGEIRVVRGETCGITYLKI